MRPWSDIAVGKLDSVTEPGPHGHVPRWSDLKEGAVSPISDFPARSAHVASTQPTSSAQSSSVRAFSSFPGNVAVLISHRSTAPNPPRLATTLRRALLSVPMPSSPALLLASSSLVPEHADRLSAGTERAGPFSSTVVRSLPLSSTAAAARERRARPPLQGVCRRLSLKRA